MGKFSLFTTFFYMKYQTNHQLIRIAMSTVNLLKYGIIPFKMSQAHDKSQLMYHIIISSSFKRIISWKFRPCSEKLRPNSTNDKLPCKLIFITIVG